MRTRLKIQSFKSKVLDMITILTFETIYKNVFDNDKLNNVLQNAKYQIIQLI